MQKLQRDIPPKKILETLNLFSHRKLPGKREPIKPSHTMLSFSVTSYGSDDSNCGKTLSFSENSGWENKLRVSKNFLRRMSFCVCLIAL